MPVQLAERWSTDNRLTALQIFEEDLLLVPNVEFVTAHFIAFSRTHVALLQQRSMPQPDGHVTIGDLSSVPFVSS